MPQKAQVDPLWYFLDKLLLDPDSGQFGNSFNTIEWIPQNWFRLEVQGFWTPRSLLLDTKRLCIPCNLNELNNSHIERHKLHTAECRRAIVFLHLLLNCCTIMQFVNRWLLQNSKHWVPYESTVESWCGLPVASVALMEPIAPSCVYQASSVSSLAFSSPSALVVQNLFN